MYLHCSCVTSAVCMCPAQPKPTPSSLARRSVEVSVLRLRQPVLQGSRQEDLPELLLACARVSRVDFNKVSSLSRLLWARPCDQLQSA